VNDGINVVAENSNIQNNFVKNVRFGIRLDNLDSAVGNVVNNTVLNYAGDGMNAYSDNTRLEANLIKNSYNVDDNHDDAIQTYPAWLAPDNLINDMIIRRNVVINTDNPSQPYQSKLQGIFCNEGEKSGWIVENNLVVVYGSGHGITMYNNITDSIIRNNIVVEQTPGDTTTDWLVPGIQMNNSENNTVEGNYVHNGPNLSANTLVYHQNLDQSPPPTVTVYDIFVDYDNYDFRLRPEYQSILSASTP
jgi:hypothetical protein